MKSMKIVSVMMVIMAIIGMTGIGIANGNGDNPCKQKCHDDGMDCIDNCREQYDPGDERTACVNTCGVICDNCKDNCESNDPEDPCDDCDDDSGDDDSGDDDGNTYTPMFSFSPKHTTQSRMCALGLRSGSEQARVDMGIIDVTFLEWGSWSEHPLYTTCYDRGYEKTMNMN